MAGLDEADRLDKPLQMNSRKKKKKRRGTRYQCEGNDNYLTMGMLHLKLFPDMLTKTKNRGRGKKNEQDN